MIEQSKLKNEFWVSESQKHELRETDYNDSVEWRVSSLMLTDITEEVVAML